MCSLEGNHSVRALFGEGILTFKPKILCVNRLSVDIGQTKTLFHKLLEFITCDLLHFMKRSYHRFIPRARGYAGIPIKFRDVLTQSRTNMPRQESGQRALNIFSWTITQNLFHTFSGN